MRSAAAIAFGYRPSRRIALAVAALCGLAAASPWPTALPAPAAAGASLLAAAAGALGLARHFRPPFRRIGYGAAGWTLTDAAGREHPAQLVSHVRLGGLLALEFRHAPGARFRPLLAPDNLDADARRRLVVLLARAEVLQPA